MHIIAVRAGCRGTGAREPNDRPVSLTDAASRSITGYRPWRIVGGRGGWAEGEGAKGRWGVPSFRVWGGGRGEWGRGGRFEGDDEAV